MSRLITRISDWVYNLSFSTRIRSNRDLVAKWDSKPGLPQILLGYQQQQQEFGAESASLVCQEAEQICLQQVLCWQYCAAAGSHAGPPTRGWDVHMACWWHWSPATVDIPRVTLPWNPQVRRRCGFTHSNKMVVKKINKKLLFTVAGFLFTSCQNMWKERFPCWGWNTCTWTPWLRSGSSVNTSSTWHRVLWDKHWSSCTTLMNLRQVTFHYHFGSMLTWYYAQMKLN